MAESVDKIKEKVGTLKESVNVFGTLAKTKDKEKLGKKQEHFMGELTQIEELINRMERTVGVGVPLTESEKAAQRLETLERDMHSIGSKVNVYVSEAKVLKTTIRELEKEIERRVSETQFQNMASRMSYLEKLSEELKLSKTKHILINLLEVMQGLDKKVDAIEKTVEEALGIYTTPETTKYAEEKKDIETIEAQPLTTDKEEKQKGFFGKITGMFRKKGG